MKVTGIIAEFNPFHAGHAYILQKAREKTDADHIVVIMSGSFTQRGIPACMDKYMRTKSALMHGADLVLELPVSYSTASAEAFAHGAVSILDALDITDCVCFGAECGDTPVLEGAADSLLNPSSEYVSALESALKAGLSFPAARAAALGSSGEILSSPNNILGIEYIKAIKRLNSNNMIPLAIARVGNGYHDLTPGDFPSAEYIRSLLLTEPASAMSVLPSDVYEICQENLGKTWPVFMEDFDQIVNYALLRMEKGNSDIQDLNSDLEDRILSHRNEFDGTASFISALKTKEITYSRINRVLLHILLGLNDMTRDSYGNLLPCPYTRILGFNRDSGELMHAMSRSSRIPVITKAADAPKLLNGRALDMFNMNVRSDRIYDSVVYSKFGTRPKDGCRISPIIYEH